MTRVTKCTQERELRMVLVVHLFRVEDKSSTPLTRKPLQFFERVPLYHHSPFRP